jgi:hypothetical protein
MLDIWRGISYEKRKHVEKVELSHLFFFHADKTYPYVGEGTVISATAFLWFADRPEFLFLISRFILGPGAQIIWFGDKSYRRFPLCFFSYIN